MLTRSQIASLQTEIINRNLQCSDTLLVGLLRRLFLSRLESHNIRFHPHGNPGGVCGVPVIPILVQLSLCLLLNLDLNFLLT